MKLKENVELQRQDEILKMTSRRRWAFVRGGKITFAPAVAVLPLREKFSSFDHPATLLNTENSNWGNALRNDWQGSADSVELSVKAVPRGRVPRLISSARDAGWRYWDCLLWSTAPGAHSSSSSRWLLLGPVCSRPAKGREAWKIFFWLAPFFSSLVIWGSSPAVRVSNLVKS